MLTVVDEYTRECMAIDVARKLGSDDLLERLTWLMVTRGVPGHIRSDNGPEFTSKRLDQWACLHGVRLDFSRLGKPTDDGLIEEFNGRLRAECLNEHWFLSLEDAPEKIECRRRHCNEDRPHSALGNLAPREFASSGQACLAG